MPSMQVPSYSSGSPAYNAASFAIHDRPHHQGSNEYISRQPFNLLPRSSRSTHDQEYGNQALSNLSVGSSQLSSGRQHNDDRVRPEGLAGSRNHETLTSGPPLQPTVVHYQIISCNGQAIAVDLNARIDKGFFFADRNWTCYRRNYFSVNCSFTLGPQRYAEPLYLLRSGLSGPTESILSFAMTINAVVDGPAGKQVELVQHTPKRDKGPQGKPDRIKLRPYTTGPQDHVAHTSMSQHTSNASLQSDTTLDESQHYSKPSVATFERIQFKSATQNNGRRRAAQQYYHLSIELHAELASSQSSAGGWTRVASRVSVPMVVRGRSPGHYQDDRRNSSSRTGIFGSSVSSGSDLSQGHSTGSLSDYGAVDDSLSAFSSSGSSYNGSLYNGQGQGYLGSLNYSPETTMQPFSPRPSHRGQPDMSPRRSVANDELTTASGYRGAFPSYSTALFGAQNR